jgi:hypothetical protein
MQYVMPVHPVTYVSGAIVPSVKLSTAVVMSAFSFLEYQWVAMNWVKYNNTVFYMTPNSLTLVELS